MSNKEEPAWTLLLIVVVLGIMGWLIWIKFSVPLLHAIRYARLVEMAPFSLFDSQIRSCMSWLWVADVGNKIPSQEAYEKAVACYGAETLSGMTTTDALAYYNVTTKSLGLMTGLVMNYIRWLVAAGCAGVGIFYGFFSIRNRFKTRHNLETFIQTQVQMWPVLTPILKFKPATASARVPGTQLPDKTPVFAEAFSPEEWLAWNRIPLSNNIPDRDRLRRAFLLQLGPRWQGIDVLPAHIQALMAAFSLQGVLKRDEAEAFLGKVAQAWTPEGGFKPSSELMAEVRKTLRDPKIGGKAVEIANRYAYRTTAVLGVLRWARFMGGVLAPAQFVWLRGEDRLLWYSLNNLGRRTFHAEGAGAIAHFMAEEAAKKPLPMPRIDTAIMTINQYLANNPNLVFPKREESRKLLNGSKA